MRMPESLQPAKRAELLSAERKRWGKKLKMWTSPRGVTEDLPRSATESRYGGLGNSASIGPIEAPNFSSGSGLSSLRKTAAIFMSALALVPSSPANVGYSISQTARIKNIH